VRSVAVPYRSAVAVGAVGSAVVSVLWAAVAADLAAPGLGLGATVVDIGVGLVFVVVALSAAGGSARHRVLVGAVGVAWLAGSALPLALPWHQGVLVLAVALFPTGRLRGPRDLAAVATALVLASGALPQGGAALAFLVVALMAVSDARNERSVRAWPTLTALGVAGVLGTAWTAGRVRGAALEPALVLAVYESLLVLVALAYVAAARSAARVQDRMTDSMLGAGELTGLAGLTSELRRAAGAPDLRIHPWSARHHAFLDENGRPVAVPDVGSGLRVDDGDRPLAVVLDGGTALADPATAEAVRSAVRLTLNHQRLQDEQRVRLGELRAARTRLVAATDLERVQLREELRTVVLSPIEAARRHVDRAEHCADPRPDGTVVEALGIVVGQLSTAGAEIAALTADLPATQLGDGRLLAALTTLAEGSPVPVSLCLDPAAEADQQTETALYYVCSEALANAAKHAEATRLTVTLRRSSAGIELVVADDGRGGADPAGTGLAGLADRVAARGGRLRAESPPGAGTVITATVPC
jgi:signal transduction histidine kinase